MDAAKGMFVGSTRQLRFSDKSNRSWLVRTQLMERASTLLDEPVGGPGPARWPAWVYGPKIVATVLEEFRGAMVADGVWVLMLGENWSRALAHPRAQQGWVRMVNGRMSLQGGSSVKLDGDMSLYVEGVVGAQASPLEVFWSASEDGSGIEWLLLPSSHSDVGYFLPDSRLSLEPQARLVLAEKAVQGI